MANTPDIVSCLSTTGSEGGSGALLPVNPFTSVRFNFGMLLGVDDLETWQGYHRGKSRLHNAWLHGEGVVWGLGVHATAEEVAHDELHVSPGLALDGAGHELHLEQEACVNLPAWYAEHKDDAELKALVTAIDPADPSKGLKFPVQVIARFKACLTREVPALSEPCEGAGSGTAFSRTFETLELLLKPGKVAHQLTLQAPPAAKPPPVLAPPGPRLAPPDGKPGPVLVPPLPADGKPAPLQPAPEQPSPTPTLVPAGPAPTPTPAPPAGPYHRLRLLFALDDPRKDSAGTVAPEDDDVLKRRANILKLASDEQPKAYLAAFRHFAALDGIDLKPFTTDDGTRLSFPAPDDAPVLLADTEVVLLPIASGGFKLKSVLITVGVRRTHVATLAIEELLCGPLFRAVPAPVTGPRGPRVLRASLKWQDAPAPPPPGIAGAYVFQTDGAVDGASVTKDSFAIATFGPHPTGWAPADIKDTKVSADGKTVTVSLAKKPAAGSKVRLIARGAGPAPILGANGLPLAGDESSPPAGDQDGIDFIAMKGA